MGNNNNTIFGVLETLVADAIMQSCKIMQMQMQSKINDLSPLTAIFNYYLRILYILLLTRRDARPPGLMMSRSNALQLN